MNGSKKLSLIPTGYDQGRPYANSVVESEQLADKVNSRDNNNTTHLYYSNIPQQERLRTPLNRSQLILKSSNISSRINEQKLEREDDTGKIQQISGGFGDSNAMDAETMKILKANQNKVDQIMAQLAPMSQEKWDQQVESEDYVMESTVFDYEELRQSENFGIKMFKDAVYRGEIVNGKRAGMGVMLYKKARLYEGFWAGDNRHGRGTERFSNGNQYRGDFKKNKPDGMGVYQWVNGEVYEGEWQNGLKEGHGIWKGIFGDSYIGQWQKSKADGYGVHQWKNGDRYEGEWKDCLKHGQGTDLFSMGDVYTGQYQFGKPHGFGQYKWKNLSSFSGQFENGQKHGKGKWRKGEQRGNIYEGDYANDKKSGMGVFTWESGNQYKGSYKDDERNGYGEMFWTDGSCYKGQWFNGIQHGTGRMEFPGGRVKQGLFENNIFVSPETPQQKTQEILSTTQSGLGTSEKQKQRDVRAEKMSIFSLGSSVKHPTQEKLNSLAFDQLQDGLRSNKVQLKRPEKLKDLQAPKKRDVSNDSVGYESINGSMVSGLTGHNQQFPSLGYMSGGLITDTESARLSNFNSQNYKSGEKSHKSLIQKFAPSNAQKPSRGGTRAESGSSLPYIKNVTQSDEMLSKLQSGSKMAGFRKASPEVINILLQQQQKLQKQSKVWKPTGQSSDQIEKNSRKLFY